ncbi:MAG: fructosamine kinase family protein [Myxococcota bacterium]
MTPSLRSTLAATFGSEVANASALSGGDINEAYAVQLADQRSVFVKTNGKAPCGMFEAEADGLRWLAEAEVIRVPEVLAYSDETPAFLALELLVPGKRMVGFDEALGRKLAALHAFGASSFGHRQNNFIGRLPQSNDTSPDWASFYWERRLAPQVRRAVDQGLLDSRTRKKLTALERALPERVGAPEPPARLHGDLWGGNLHVDGSGAPCLIDPAVYGGHREVDLAMMRLFGGFGASVFAAYEEVSPLAAGAADRIPLYQLYPLLVHVNLFGGSYARSVDRTLDACV